MAVSLFCRVRFYHRFVERWCVRGPDLMVWDFANEERQGRVSFDFADEAILWGYRFVGELEDRHQET